MHSPRWRSWQFRIETPGLKGSGPRKVNLCDMHGRVPYYDSFTPLGVYKFLHDILPFVRRLTMRVTCRMKCENNDPTPTYAKAAAPIRKLTHFLCQPGMQHDPQIDNTDKDTQRCQEHSASVVVTHNPPRQNKTFTHKSMFEINYTVV